MGNNVKTPPNPPHSAILGGIPVYYVRTGAEDAASAAGISSIFFRRQDVNDHHSVCPDPPSEPVKRVFNKQPRILPCRHHRSYPISIPLAEPFFSKVGLGLLHFFKRSNSRIFNKAVFQNHEHFASSRLWTHEPGCFRTVPRGTDCESRGSLRDS